MHVQGVQEKLCFFTIHCNPFLAYIAVRDLQSSQHNTSVQSLLLAGNFCTTNSSRVLARERLQILVKKTQYLMHTLYYMECDEERRMGGSEVSGR